MTLHAQSALVSGDPARLTQIVTNLLDNAVKFTPRGGSIDVDVFRDDRQAVLRVRDTGVGIDPETLPRVFDLFSQAAQPMDRSVGGLGIGLTLTRRLVEMHGGTIVARSKGHGHGAEFTVRMPTAITAQRPPVVRVHEAEGRRRVLLIEDNDDARESLRLLLESLGHQVVTASDGRAGLLLAGHEPPEVAVIDLGLPGLDGYEVARALRAGPGGKAITLIAVSGYGQAQDRQRSMEAGFDAHLVKPVSPTVLASLIATPRA